MSDDFDKEAEKEKLREQLAEEEAEREATQQMSELLLKGATMTNQHCDECGDPLFRHEGQEFCPSCGRQRPADGQSTEVDANGSQRAEDEAGVGAPTETSGTLESTQPTSTETAANRATDSRSRQQAPAPAATGDADLPAARDALARKVTTLAQEAEATTDVGRARDLLAAVREGAEAIRALDGTGR
ncbi:MAG: Sjogren's syndrome/scleroderma autoantigen 1 family protein [Halobacteriales archaeon]